MGRTVEDLEAILAMTQMLLERYPAALSEGDARILRRDLAQLRASLATGDERFAQAAVDALNRDLGLFAEGIQQDSDEDPGFPLT